MKLRQCSIGLVFKAHMFETVVTACFFLVIAIVLTCFCIKLLIKNRNDSTMPSDFGICAFIAALNWIVFLSFIAK